MDLRNLGKKLEGEKYGFIARLKPQGSEMDEVAGWLDMEMNS